MTNTEYRYEADALAIVSAIKRDYLPQMDENDGGEIQRWIMDLVRKVLPVSLLLPVPDDEAEAHVKK